MKNTKQLINNIIGQLEGVSRMVEEGQDCFSVLNQMKASRSALRSLMNKYIENNFNDCMNCKTREKKNKIKKLIVELNNME